MSKNNNDTFGKTDDDAVSVLIEQVNHLAITVFSQTKVVKFLVNVPMYIPASDMAGIHLMNLRMIHLQKINLILI
ncbi:hypothetical protein N3Z16_10250 (plasmid) [Candidatus Megaera polyxenophila]|uniref:hypothetical protein n=1 Tax=Candidatus Megaera polyxenophila TaxID=988779 RepID=UPI00249F223E|nr:hypothetical protein N3Z16_10250 [Candidatus Megaera polyxenophila]